MKCYFIEKPFYTFKPFLMDHSQSFDPLTHKHCVYIIIFTRDECQCKSPLVNHLSS